METNLAILRLSQLLPREVKIRILNVLINNRSLPELARNLGCPPITVEKRLRGNNSDDEEMSKMLVLALQSDETMGILQKFFREIKLLLEQLNLLERQKKMDLLMEGLDDRSRWIVHYFTVKRHANIMELATLIGSHSHMDVLMRLREIINPKAEAIFGEPFINFKSHRIDSLTGESVLFSWWLSENQIEGLSHNDVLLDVFDEGNHLKVLAYLPSRDYEDLKVRIEDSSLIISAEGYCKEAPLHSSVEGIIEKTYNNGVLEVKLKKAV